MVRRGGLQEVELVDGELTADAPGRRRAPLRWVVVGLLVLGVGLAATQGMLTARERAAIAELARVPGVLSPVDETLVV